MKVLTKEELAALNPERVYLLPLIMNYDLWNKLNKKLVSNLKKPKRVKFNEEIQNHLSKSAKGIYMFIVEPEFTFEPEIKYLLYIGKVTQNDTFYKRFYEYVNAIGNKNQRRNIQLLTNLWPDKTYVYIYELNQSDDDIEEIETQIFNYIIPPLNNYFTIKESKNTRNIYN